MTQSTYKISLKLGPRVVAEGRDLDREEFFVWLWSRFEDRGLLGVHEGTLLSEDAHRAGLETESWTIDSGEAPRERDWVGHETEAEAQLYFESAFSAESASKLIKRLTGISSQVVEQKPQDWDAEWKASFQGAFAEPFWWIIPPWVDAEAKLKEKAGIVLQINPGAGFGTGTHETTQLCLGALARVTGCDPGAKPLQAWRVLDFGSGSGILSIGAGLLGAEVLGIEIDPLAVENATENLSLNPSVSGVRFYENLEASETQGLGPYDLVMANILRPVLIEFASLLTRRLKRDGVLILSGLMAPDLDEVTRVYSKLLDGKPPRTHELGEWRALVWKL